MILTNEVSVCDQSLELKLQHQFQNFYKFVLLMAYLLISISEANQGRSCGRLIRERRMGRNLRADYNLQRVMRIQSLIFIPILITIFVTTMDLQCIIFHPCYSLCQKNETSSMPSAFLTPLPYALLYFFTDCIREINWVAQMKSMEEHR